ncbi:hydroxysqualene dehydroxylase HpnE [Saccharopolyspora gloriosae]|uniref:hydroxysqualene dehydroxylase HpnE n=1 Tax=Saccharopolyspora gloriosae TaxID=455344 RepID=UPI001FB6762F|nr:hydroxysqualene dehydroxylase HpnE [Saccharopolyspora gloriosae]
MSSEVLVVGGGLAGVTAALRCADEGFRVTLLESRARLGGAAGSFQRGELAVDTGQHVILRCYTAYRALLRRIGAADEIRLQPRLRIPVLSPTGRPSVLLRRRLPAPAHFAPALLGYGELGLGDRLGAARTAMALRALDPADPALDEISFGAWLRSRGESGRAVDALWGLLSVAALNAQPERASLALAVKVFRTGVLDAPDAADIGIPSRPLGELHGTVAHRALDTAGVRVLLRTKAAAVRRDEPGWRVPVRGRGGDDVLNADSVVLAVPHSHATALLAGLPLPQARRWAGLSAAPIVNVHVRYDRPVLGEPMAAVLDSPVQWLFDRTSIAGAPHGQYLAISLSAAHEYLDRRADEVREVFLPALRDVLPAARHARVEDFFVTREPRATFDQTPGTGALRPAADIGPTGLALAGAWTATGWPDTLEGAVRSGEQAVRVLRTAAGDASRAGVEVPR